jgi:hypothetical protein
MHFLADNLKKDLRLEDKAIRRLHGEMSDVEQNQMVEDFSRGDSDIRILVASDVASEGINLHYFCHRLIHFDIPWSLIVFQQRNGRIDRYGQLERPDIRYIRIDTKNETIRGDLSIIYIVAKKAEQARDNLGDAPPIMCKDTADEETKYFADAIQAKMSTEDFNKSLDEQTKGLDLFENFMKKPAQKVSVDKNDGTLLSDIKYIELGMPVLSEHFGKRIDQKPFDKEEFGEVNPFTRLGEALSRLMPDEALTTDTIKLSHKKERIKKEMAEGLYTSTSKDSWNEVQFLWKLHPIFTWMKDIGEILYKRDEVPLLGIDVDEVPNESKIVEGDIIFIVAGTVCNELGHPVIDEWRGLLYRNGEESCKELTMKKVLAMTDLSEPQLPNALLLQTERNSEHVNNAKRHLADAISKMEEILVPLVEVYENEIREKKETEAEKLDILERKHIEFVKSKYKSDDLLKQEEQKTRDMFSEHRKRVEGAYELQEFRYVRIIAVLVGCAYVI